MDIINEHIINGCRKSDRKAQIELYKYLAPRLYRTCFRIIGNETEAEEAMQDSVLKVLKSLSEPGDKVEFVYAWCLKIAVRTAIDYVRRNSMESEELKEYSLSDEADEEADEDYNKHSVEKVKKAMQELPPGYRVVLSLYLFEGYDMEEIGEILKIKAASVRSQYLRAKMKLLEILESK